MHELFLLFITFAKIGAVTFGGGIAMLPLIQLEVVEKHHWITEEELIDFYAISRCTPGVVIVNTATHIGARIRGVPGAIFTTLGAVLPSLITISLVASVLSNFAQLPAVKDAFVGLRICAWVLIFNAIRKIIRAGVVDWVTFSIAAAVFLLSILTDLSSAVLVVTAGFIGLAIKKAKGDLK